MPVKLPKELRLQRGLETLAKLKADGKLKVRNDEKKVFVPDELRRKEYRLGFPEELKQLIIEHPNNKKLIIDIYLGFLNLLRIATEKGINYKQVLENFRLRTPSYNKLLEMALKEITPEIFDKIISIGLSQPVIKTKNTSRKTREEIEEQLKFLARNRIPRDEYSNRIKLIKESRRYQQVLENAKRICDAFLKEFDLLRMTKLGYTPVILLPETHARILGPLFIGLLNRIIPEAYQKYRKLGISPVVHVYTTNIFVNAIHIPEMIKHFENPIFIMVDYIYQGKTEDLIRSELLSLYNSNKIKKSPHYPEYDDSVEQFKRGEDMRRRMMIANNETYTPPKQLNFVSFNTERFVTVPSEYLVEDGYNFVSPRAVKAFIPEYESRLIEFDGLQNLMTRARKGLENGTLKTKKEYDDYILNGLMYFEQVKDMYRIGKEIGSRFKEGINKR